MTVHLIVARHGNTFGPDETPRRIGARTDLPLVESGEAQARRLGAYLRDHRMIPDVIYTSRLQRTRQTAQLALIEAGVQRPGRSLDIFDEIDHGPDENKTDPEVVARLGGRAFDAWEKESAMPKDWSPRPDVIRKNWMDFATLCEKAHDNQTVLAVTSNGVARFLPQLANNAEDIVTPQNRKLRTGAFCVLEGSGGLWMISDWNKRP